jgi:hypothetical protein
MSSLLRISEKFDSTLRACQAQILLSTCKKISLIDLIDQVALPAIETKLHEIKEEAKDEVPQNNTSLAKDEEEVLV